MNQNRYNIKKQTFVQRHYMVINAALTVLGLGILFSRPIYESFSYSSEEIEELRTEVLREHKLKLEKREQKKQEEAAKKQEEAAKKAAEAATKVAEVAKKEAEPAKKQ